MRRSWRQGVGHKNNPFIFPSGCKVRYEADMSNETLQSSKGRAIKAHIKLMELVIRGSIKGIQRAVSRTGDQCRRLINTWRTAPMRHREVDIEDHLPTRGGLKLFFAGVHSCSPERSDNLPQQANTALAVHPSVLRCQ